PVVVPAVQRNDRAFALKCDSGDIHARERVDPVRRVEHVAAIGASTYTAVARHPYRATDRFVRAAFERRFDVTRQVDAVQILLHVRRRTVLVPLACRRRAEGRDERVSTLRAVEQYVTVALAWRRDEDVARDLATHRRQRQRFPGRCLSRRELRVVTAPQGW